MRQLAASTTWMFRWEVSSMTSDKTYIVAMKTNGTWACDCANWKFHKAPKIDCKHMTKVKMVEEKTAGAWPIPDNPGKPKLVAPPAPQAYFVLQSRRAIKLED